jgi:putative hydrolase of the HAD superfamily
MGMHSSRAIVFDGDDTLWATQELYDAAKEHFFSLLAELGHSRDDAVAKFARIDVANVARLGLARERFPQSMQETYEAFCRAAGVEPDSLIAERAVAIGRAVFEAVPVVRPDARDVLGALRASYRLILFTAGDPEVQQQRIEQSGLGQYFDSIHITPQKSLETWGELLTKEDLHGAAAWSVGNSVRSDINPALRHGMRCVVVAGRTWEYERVALEHSPDGVHVWHAATLSEAAHVICSIDHGSQPRVTPGLLLARLREERRLLEAAFAPDTAYPSSAGSTASSGHCAVVAAITQQRLGGKLLSANVEGESHWFNRLPTAAGECDVDLTGDQFGRPPVQVQPAGQLYESGVVRPFADLLPETLERASRLAARAGFPEIAQAMDRARALASEPAKPYRAQVRR